MLYVIYNKTTDTNAYVTEDKSSALMYAGECIDYGYADDLIVHKYDMTEEEYDECLDPQLVGWYTIKGFIEQFGEEPTFSELTPAEAERLINLSPEEKDFVVMHIPDATLIAELSRRVNEYRKYADKVSQANAELRIFI
ncbi:MAG: hypothetical protein IKW90_07705 [Lachnospiraceae bacterium]|nr:hypothetical protein [Lachnospiraceae bacterium]